MTKKSESEMAKEALESSLHCAESGEDKETQLIPADSGEGLAFLAQIANSGKYVAVLTVLVTLLVKKVIDPEQDIRLHRTDFTGGFSGRSFDTKHITPFLRDNDFPHMKSGSGWLTRSLEQFAPYDMNYPGKIQPKLAKSHFLNLIDKIEKNEFSADSCLRYIFQELVKHRNESQELVLSRPQNLSIQQIIDILDVFWRDASSGASRVPVLAVYAAYKCLTTEVSRYQQLKILDLESHTSADSKTGRSGDIDFEMEGKIVESVEIKHNLPIDAELVKKTINKNKSNPVNRLYLLSTNEDIVDTSGVKRLTKDARDRYGSEIIVDGLGRTLLHLLRLLTDTNDFINAFVSYLEKDKEVSYDVKKKWNKVVDEMNQEK